MSRVTFHRPVRAVPPVVPDQRVSLPAVPQEQQSAGSASSLLTLALPIMSSVSLAAYMITEGKPLLIALGCLFVIGSVGATLGIRHQMRKGTRQNKVRQRQRYLDYLAEIRQSVRQVAARQRLAAAWTHPSPQRLWAIAGRRRRVWERRPADPDFLQVRLGLGRGGIATPIQLANRADPLADYDEEIMAAARRLTSRLAMVGRQPALAELGAAGVVSLLGPRDQVRALARSVVLQIAVLHAPDDVALMIRTAGSPDWEWAKWLPHAHEAEPAGAPEVVPLVAADIDGLADVLDAELERAREHRAARQRRAGAAGMDGKERRHLVVVLDSYDPAAPWARTQAVTGLLDLAGPDTGITVICLVEAEPHQPTRTLLRARVGEDGSLALEGPHAQLFTATEDAVADQADPVLAELTARALAPLRLSEEPDRVLSRIIDLPGLLGVTDLSNFDPAGSWLAPDDDRVLRLPVGLDGDGQPVELDLKESAQGGMGPHGLVVGATGSGKSELLRTLVTGLTMTHSPELLSLVLVDFKGGATFAGLTELPHVAGLITNLADDLSLVDRVRAALHGEQQRRQKLLRDAGNVDSLREYQARQAAGHSDIDGKPLEPLPYLLIVVDEFGELLSQRSDFIELFVQIGRVGRSLGMHLLLATQRLEEGRLRGLESHLSYRICLRTFSAAESRAVIGTTDAYQLPSIPGSAYLKVDESTYRRFRVAHMSGPYDDPAGLGQPAAMIDITEFALRTAPAPELADEGQARPSRPILTGPTAMQVAVSQLCRFGQPVHQVWLPPLPAVVPLDALLGPPAEQPGRGWQASLWPWQGQLSFPVGLIDLPFAQRQEALVLDFARKHGNLVVVGAPQSGKSTLLRTMMLAAMLTHTPNELRYYCLDFGGGTLTQLAGAPHVGTVASRRDPHLARRLISEMLRIVTAREQLFAEYAVDSAAAFRNLTGTGKLPDGEYTGEVFVVIDNWGAVRAELEDIEASVVEIAFRGLGVGVHLVLTANRWADVRMNLRDGFGARLELRLNDPAESEVNRQVSRQIAASPPGRGVATPGLLFHALAPRLDGRDTVEDIGEAQEEVIAKITGSWRGIAAPPIRLLPDLVTVTELAGRFPVAAGDTQAAGVLIGLADTDLGPVGLNLTEGDPHLLVLGDAGAGKTAFLHTLMGGLAARYGPDQVRFMLTDYRHSLTDAAPDTYVGAYAGDAAAAREYTAQLAAVLAKRLPPPGISSRKLRERDWWTGPELYLIADDYDLVATGQVSPLAEIADYIPQSREIGLHVILARRVSGMARVLASDALLSRIRDLGTSGLVLSGDPREGVLLGSERAAERPPGRGVLVRRREPSVLVQVALSDPGPQ
jgi:S-DNA-T family DNA segregation ATPase FtsK/SpoIIIE